MRATEQVECVGQPDEDWSTIGLALSEAVVAKDVVSGGAKRPVSGGLGKKIGAGRVASGDILAAPKGKRTVSHRWIEAAVEKVFRERAGMDAKPT
jgi:hypothetical protein